MSQADIRPAPLHDDIVQTAIDWRLRLSDDQASPDDVCAFERWLADDPAHRDAWERLGRGLRQSVGCIEPLLLDPRNNLRQTLIKPSVTRRRFMSKLFGFCAVGLGTAWLIDQQVPLRNLVAEFGTGTGERSAFVLPDGSRMILDARSRVDLDFSDERRQVRLLAGALDMQAVSEEPRPFVVQTGEGSIQALADPVQAPPQDNPKAPDGYFMVRQEAHGTLVVVRQHRVLVQNLAGAQQYVDGGMGLRFNASHIAAVDPRLYAHAAWTDGYLEAHDRSLGEVVAALAEYFPGVLRVSDEAAALRVSGFFPLDTPDRALQALEQTLPIRLRRYTRWVVTIDLATPRRRT